MIKPSEWIMKRIGSAPIFRYAMFAACMGALGATTNDGLMAHAATADGQQGAKALNRQVAKDKTGKEVAEELEKRYESDVDSCDGCLARWPDQLRDGRCTDSMANLFEQHRIFQRVGDLAQPVDRPGKVAVTVALYRFL